ncbi:MAG TPA: hypothetical protein VIJ92_11325 [Ginsengibacter sp.]
MLVHLIAYLVEMETNEKVQFVCFETTLDKEQFGKRWEQFRHSLNSNNDVTLQQNETEGRFNYVAQHRFTSSELEFKFSNEGRNSRIVQVPIKSILAGGYSILQANRLHNAAGNERKIIIFLSDPRADLKIYKQLFTAANLNIYEAYYENCKYSYILEYFVKTRDSLALLEQLKQYDTADVAIYKEYAHIKDIEGEKKKDFYVWPTH